MLDKSVLTFVSFLSLSLSLSLSFDFDFDFETAGFKSFWQMGPLFASTIPSLPKLIFPLVWPSVQMALSFFLPTRIQF
jgi:hypothetical protein